MSGYRRFNAQEMLEYLAEVDEELVLAGADPVHLVAVGGAAMMTRRASRMTGDIDIVSEGMSPRSGTGPRAGPAHSRSCPA